MTFSEKLIMLRRSNGLSQEKLAEILDVSRQSVSKWESQSCLPEAIKLKKLGEIFGISVDALLKDEVDLHDTLKCKDSEDASVELDVIFCTQCGAENKADSKFCGYCGHPFTSFTKCGNKHASLTKDDMDMAYYKMDLQIQQQALQLQQQELEALRRSADLREEILHQQKKSFRAVARCPRCGSTAIAIESHKKGYGFLKGLAGVAIAGPVGMIAGTIGANTVKTKRVCLKCKHRF